MTGYSAVCSKAQPVLQQKDHDSSAMSALYGEKTSLKKS